ncbi:MULTISPECIES: TadE/TadG family type IV pilus assembly protein [unclassified Mesorhizobium]|uniref:TadE/TadG family type IV pilus assembly protein n=1 Tax=unclassified Mesorhizobium TaxID=325217 RepID=UPI0004052F6F|nr:TadE/TadG family type IV pilus assembly protein [Mesorhizobium sp. L103C119B0]
MRFCSDRRGVAAIEFAFVVPVLLIMYFVTMEASQAIETSKNVSRVSSMVADLITQQQTIVATDIDAIMKIGTSTLQPYRRSTPTIIVTAIHISDSAALNVEVVWSRKVGSSAGGPITVPPALRIRNTFLIRVQSILGYVPVIAWSADNSQQLGLTSAFSTIVMKETYYLRPRRSTTIPCSGC